MCVPIPITSIAVKVEDIRKEHQGVLETAMTRAGQALGWKSRGLAKDTVRGGDGGTGAAGDRIEA